MGYVIGKIKNDRNTLARDGELVDAPIISVSGGTLDTSKYDDITSMSNWIKYGKILCTDGYQMADRIKDIVDEIKWSGTTDEDKDILINYHIRERDKDSSTASTEKIMYLMGKGLSQEESKEILQEAYSRFHLIEVDSSTKRVTNEKLYTVISKYLNISDAGDLIKITHKLFDLYKTQGIRGINDGNAGEGLFDFLESTTGTSYETSGLREQGYVLNDSKTYDDFINEIMDILRYGNY
jgi:hypothetical protein